MIGQRVTRQRTVIGALLDDLGDFRSAQQIHTLLTERGAVPSYVQRRVQDRQGQGRQARLV